MTVILASSPDRKAASVVTESTWSMLLESFSTRTFPSTRQLLKILSRALELRRGRWPLAVRFYSALPTAEASS
jgi:hypothetical protein